MTHSPRRPALAGPALRVLAAVAVALTALVALSGPASAEPVPPANTAPCPRWRGIPTGRPLPPCRPPCITRSIPPRLCPPPDPAPAPEPILAPGVYAVRDFVAVVNSRVTTATPTLVVTGVATVATPGYSVTLVPTNPQGINPDILLLDVVVTPPDRFVPQVIVDVDVRFESTDFTHVSVVSIPDLGLNLDVTAAV